MTPIIEAAQRVRDIERQKKNLTAHNVEWDLDPSFIGESMSPKTLKKLSLYVDRRLADYSSIYGTKPATNAPVQLLYDDPTQATDGRVTRLLNTDNNSTTEIFHRNPHDTTEEESLETFRIESLKAYSKSDTEKIQEGIIKDHHRTGLEAYIPEDAALIEDEHLISESDDAEGKPHYSFKANGSELFAELENITPQHYDDKDDEDLPDEHVASDSDDITFQQATDILRQQGRVYEGISPTNFITNDRVDSRIRMRIRDSFIRNPRVPAAHQDTKPDTKHISYVTSYSIEHQHTKIKARIITAPADQRLNDELWFELCCNDSRPPRDSLKDVIKDTVKANLCILAPSRGQPLANLNAPEITALETLRDMISEQDYRNYLRYGFITIRARSGKLYQISRSNPHTKVYLNGQLVEEICIRLKDPNIPLTDNVIAFKAMIETDENAFKSLGNTYKMTA